MKRKSEKQLVDYGYTLKIELPLGGAPSIELTAAPEETPDAIRAIEAATAALHRVARVPDATSGPSAGPTLKEAIAIFLERDDLKPVTRRRYAPGLSCLANFLGPDNSLRSITQARFAEFAVSINARTDIAPKTKNMLVTLGGTFFNWCGSRYDGISQISTNKLKTRRKAPERDDRSAFTLEELGELVLSAERYRKTEPHKYWVTVVCIFTGMRLEEICQLDIREDIRNDEASGYWYLDVNGRGGGSVKTLAGWRKVPLHPAVVEAGFIRFVDDVRKAGADRLFPAWRPREDPTHGGKIYGHEASKWGGRQLAWLRNEKRITRDKLTYFHSMRHAFVNHLKQAQVAEEIRAALVGHEVGGINQNRYGKEYSSKLLGDTLVAALAAYPALIGATRA